MFARQLRLLAGPLVLALSLTLPQLALAQFTPDIPIGLTPPSSVQVALGSSTPTGSLPTTHTAGPERSATSALPIAAAGFQISFWAGAALLLASRRWFR